VRIYPSNDDVAYLVSHDDSMPVNVLGAGPAGCPPPKGVTVKAPVIVAQVDVGVHGGVVVKLLKVATEIILSGGNKARYFTVVGVSYLASCILTYVWKLLVKW
jgi:hypothetical protein